MTAHSELCGKISDYLKSLGPDCWFFRPNNMGYGRKGIPDFVGCSTFVGRSPVLGTSFVIEVKVRPDEPTTWQNRELDAHHRAGGVSIVAYSLKDVTDRI